MFAFAPVGLLILILAAVAIAEVVVERRASQQRSMCTLLALTMERGLPLESSQRLAESAAGTSVGLAMARLLDALRRGTPLTAAIRQHPSALPPTAIAYVAAGRSLQAEAAALKELSVSDASGLRAIWQACVDRLAYLGTVLVLMVAILTFVMIKIVPEFHKIFEEFELELPRLTHYAVEVSRFTVNYLAAPLVAFVAFSMLALLVVGLLSLFGVPVLRPVADWVFRGRRTGDVLRILALATEHRQPLATVMERLGHVYPSPRMRTRLKPAAAAIAAGADWRDALRDARLIGDAERALLTSAEPAGNLPWVLRSIAGRREKRAVFRLAGLVQVLFPCVILALGAVVAFYVVALFIPILRLIEGLSG